MTKNTARALIAIGIVVGIIFGTFAYMLVSQQRQLDSQQTQINEIKTVVHDTKTVVDNAIAAGTRDSGASQVAIKQIADMAVAIGRIENMLCGGPCPAPPPLNCGPTGQCPPATG